MNIEDKIRSLLESVDGKTPAQLSYPGATGLQDPPQYMQPNFEELEFDRPGVVTDEIQQVQYPGQTPADPQQQMVAPAQAVDPAVAGAEVPAAQHPTPFVAGGDAVSPLGAEFQELDPFNMSNEVAQVPKENYPIGSGANDVAIAPDDNGVADDEFSKNIKPASHPAPFVAESVETSSGYVPHKAKKISAASEGKITVLDKASAKAVEKKLGLPAGSITPAKKATYGETIVVKGSDNKLHTVYAKGTTVRVRPYGHNDQESTGKLAAHLNESYKDGGLIDTAYQWHGGQTSPLYSFASTGGIVHDEDHRNGLVREINRNITYAKKYESDGDEQYTGETNKLQALKDHVQSAPLKQKLNEDTTDNQQQQENPVDQHNEIVQQAVAAVQAGNKLEDVAKATGLDAKEIQDAIEAATPTQTPTAPVTTAPVAEDTQCPSTQVDAPQKPETNIDESELKQDVENLLGEETLSEEFKAKAGAIFEAAVIARVNNEAQRLEEAYNTKLATEVQSLQESYVQAVEVFAEQQSTRLGNYINYLGEQWLKQNKVAVESGIKNELTEGFMKGLQKLFTEHYINAPEEKLDLVEEQKAQIAQLQESINSLEQNIETLNESNHNLQREVVINRLSEGLTDIEAAKLQTLCEGIQFTNQELFESQVDMIKKNFLVRKAAPSPEQLLESTVHANQPQADEVAQKPAAQPFNSMAAAVKALDRFRQA